MVSLFWRFPRDLEAQISSYESNKVRRRKMTTRSECLFVSVNLWIDSRYREIIAKSLEHQNAHCTQVSFLSTISPPHAWIFASLKYKYVLKDAAENSSWIEMYFDKVQPWISGDMSSEILQNCAEQTRAIFACSIFCFLIVYRAFKAKFNWLCFDFPGSITYAQ